MHEKGVVVPIPKTKLNIHGVLRGSYGKPLVILEPGLGGWMHETLLFNASRYLEKEGFSSLRVSLYGDGADQRNIPDYDVHTHAEDTDTLVGYAKRQGADWIAVVGHSYSGMGILYSKKQAFNTAVLWDPSHTDGYSTLDAQFNLKKDFIYIKKLDAYVSGLGSGYVIGRKVFEDYEPGSTVKAQNFKLPTLIVNGSFSKEMQKYGKLYAEAITAPTKQITIPNSSHPFTEDGAMERLFAETTSWLKSQL